MDWVEWDGWVCGGIMGLDVWWDSGVGSVVV